jgi:cell division protein FtsB
MKYSKESLKILGSLIKTLQTEENETLRKENRKLKRENKELKGENKRLKKQPIRTMSTENHNRIAGLVNDLDEKLFNNHI